MSTWTITKPEGGIGTLAAVGLTIASVNLALAGQGRMSLTAARPYDGPWYAAGQIVTVYCNGNRFFTGRAMVAPRGSEASAEMQSLDLAETWSDLDTIYKEPWGIGGTPYELPLVVLGIDPSGNPISTGQQAAAAITYAQAKGAHIQPGSIPTGFTLWQSEERGITCREVVEQSIAENIEWYGVMDHSSAPPALNIFSYDSMPSSSIDVVTGGSGFRVKSFNYSESAAQFVEGVEITYLTSSLVDNVEYRDASIDSAGDTSGLHVISEVIDIQGESVSRSKQRIVTRPLPSNQADAKDWLIAKLATLKDVNPSHFDIVSWTKTLDDTAYPTAVNSNLPRRVPASVNDVPNELVDGSIEDWMRVFYSDVLVKFSLKPSSSATKEEKEKINSVDAVEVIRVKCTSAVTKTYTGNASWTPGSNRPVGLAAAIYAAASKPKWSGSVTLRYQDYSGESWIGTKLRLRSGGTTLMEYGVVHSQSVDIGAGLVSIAFGPPPYISPSDFLDISRRIRQRARTKWYTVEERGGSKSSSQNGVSSRGDSVGGLVGPSTQIEYKTQDPSPVTAWSCELSGTDASPKVKVTPGNLVNLVTGSEGGVSMTELDIADGHIVYLEANITDGAVSSIELKSGERWEGHPKPWKFEGTAPAKQTKAYRQLCECETVDDQLVLARIEAGNLTLGLDIIDKKLGFVFQ